MALMTLNPFRLPRHKVGDLDEDRIKNLRQSARDQSPASLENSFTTRS